MQTLKQQFISWLHTKPAGEEYNYCNPRVCALAQFGAEMGYDHLIGLEGVENRYPDIYDALNPLVGGFTYGALRERLMQQDS
jgi:hypothetical protein